MRVIDDDIYEGPEQFAVGLFDPTGGAVLGDAMNAACNIGDNDESAGHVLGFERDSYLVDPSGKKAELRIVRSGDIYDYLKFEISTRSGSAKADEHYVPVMTDAMFLPGETEKKVLIPLLTDGVSEELRFDVVLTRDEKPAGGTGCATVTLTPTAGGLSLMAAPTETYYRDRVVIQPWNGFTSTGSHYVSGNLKTVFPYTAEHVSPYGMRIPLPDNLTAPTGRAKARDSERSPESIPVRSAL